MNVIETKLPGVLIVEPRVFRDDRGYFLETWSSAKYGPAGLPTRFEQDNLSCSAVGVLRGLHYQFPTAQGKLVSVIRGEVFDVAVDIRVGSPTFGKWEGATLSAENARQLYIPEGFAHGFLVTGDEPAHFLYKCTEGYDPAGQCSIVWDDPDIGIEWPGAAPLLAPKDRDAPPAPRHPRRPAPPIPGRRLMAGAVPIVLWAWVPVTLLLFWRLAPDRAAAASMIGGWLVLPTARFADDVAGVDFPYWIMPSCLPSDYWTTKARVIGVALLVGISTFDPGAWRRLRPSAFDVPMVGWCLVPILSGLANGLPIREGLADSIYQAMAWGVPYLAGRMYFADPAGMAILGRGIVAAGLACVPFCLVEAATGPIFYRALFGFHPYQLDGATRAVGFRPILLLEHGNQLGIWMASSAMAAFWLQRSGQMARFLKMPGSLVVGLLTTASVLTQSAGAVALLVGGLASMELIRRADRRWPLVALLALPLAFVGARAANLVDVKALATKTGIGRRLVDASTKLDRSRSFGWRLQVEQRAAKVALQRPILGWARWDWWRAGAAGERPWGLLSLVLGMDGLVGWVLLLGCFASPLVAFLNLGPPRFWSTSRAAASAMAGVLAINALDAILNPCFLLPMMTIAGGLVGLRSHAKAASAWIDKLHGGPPTSSRPQPPGVPRWSTTWLLGPSWPGSRSR